MFEHKYKFRDGERVSDPFSLEEILLPGGKRYKHAWSIIMMQYTGHIDQNGEEIYEGQIVKSQQYRKSPKGDYVRKNGSNYYTIVRTENGGFGCKESGDRMHSVKSLHGYIEVIGNIYENPELAPTKREKKALSTNKVHEKKELEIVYISAKED